MCTTTLKITSDMPLWDLYSQHPTLQPDLHQDIHSLRLANTEGSTGEVVWLGMVKLFSTFQTFPTLPLNLPSP